MEKGMVVNNEFGIERIDMEKSTEIVFPSYWHRGTKTFDTGYDMYVDLRLYNGVFEVWHEEERYGNDTHGWHGCIHAYYPSKQLYKDIECAYKCLSPNDAIDKLKQKVSELNIELQKNNKDNRLIALKSGYYFQLFPANEITMNIEEIGAVQLMGEQYPLYSGKEYTDAQAIDRLFGDSMGNLISEHRIIDEPDITDDF